MNWIDTTVGEFCPFIYGKGLPKTKRQAGEYPVYGSNGCVDFHNDFYINGPGIIIGRKGSVGAVHLSTQPFWPIDTAFYVTKATLGELRFTYYLLKSLGLEKMNSDSAVPGLNRDNAHALSIRIPESPESRESLGNQMALLDEKIAANSGVNQTLEEMAQAIFKSWFVDFDPVKAKMNGEQPEGIDAATASLFPEKLVESELGLIPEGWEVKSVGEFTDTFDYVANGSFAALKANVDLFDEPNDVLYVRTTDFNKGFKNDLKYTNESSYQFLSKSKLYGHETIISNVGDVGTVFRAPSWYDMPMTLGSNAMGIVAEGANSYIYYLFKSHTGQHLLDGITSGSAQMKFNKTSFRKLRVVLPSNELLAKFEELEAALWAKHASNQKESLHLEKLRDTLLPKLLSGEIELGQDQELAEVE
ncbi:TPA: restriction endonuclease subunit S [Vibrio parahaemolyticus]|nr:restriction endonuclease subunit S [Vibrio parahaemolyticus]HCE4677233.1 restriction endonuclease subunit S [Vibrio parahaemolyticus]